MYKGVNMRKIKFFLVALSLAIATLSFTGCGGGEADYTLGDVQNTQYSGLRVVSSSKITVDNTEIVISRVQVQTNSTVTYRIIGGDPERQYFDINASTGKLSFIAGYDPTPLINNNKYYVLILEISNTKNELITATLEIKVVRDKKTIPPEISSRDSVSISGYDTYLLDIEASTPSKTQLHYAISGGADSSRFMIDQESGKLSFITAPNDFDPSSVTSDRVFYVEVEVTDSNPTVLSTRQSITINVYGDKTKIPPELLTRGPFNVQEGSYTVGTLQGSHSRQGAVLSFVLEGNDANLFTLEPLTGVLTFKNAVDWEKDRRTYNISAYVEDELNNRSASIAYIVNIIDISWEYPSFTMPSSINVTEGTTGTILTASATSPLENAVLRYRFYGSYDNDEFTLDTVSGAIAFKSPPTYATGLFGDNSRRVYIQVYDQYGNTKRDSTTVYIKQQ